MSCCKETKTLQARVFEQLQLEELIRVLEKKYEERVDTDTIDDCIHGIFESKASDVNNGGLYSQIEFLIQENGVASTMEYLEALAGHGV